MSLEGTVAPGAELLDRGRHRPNPSRAAGSSAGVMGPRHFHCRQGEYIQGLLVSLKINFSKSLGLKVFSFAVYRIKSSLVTVKRKK